MRYGDPIVGKSMPWSHLRQHIWSVGDGSRDHRLNVGVLKTWDQVHGCLRILRYPVEIRLEQLLTETYEITEGIFIIEKNAKPIKSSV